MARPDKLPKILTEEETEALLSQPNRRYFGPHRDYLFMRLMLKAGLRASYQLQDFNVHFFSHPFTQR